MYFVKKYAHIYNLKRLRLCQVYVHFFFLKQIVKLNRNINWDGYPSVIVTGVGTFPPSYCNCVGDLWHFS